MLITPPPKPPKSPPLALSLGLPLRLAPKRARSNAYRDPKVLISCDGAPPEIGAVVMCIDLKVSADRWHVTGIVWSGTEQCCRLHRCTASGAVETRIIPLWGLTLCSRGRT